MLPRTHGSALFTRGETQALAVATLGTARAALRSDNLSDEDDRHFYLQYFFPPSSVGEVSSHKAPPANESQLLIQERDLST